MPLVAKKVPIWHLAFGTWHLAPPICDFERKNSNSYCSLEGKSRSAKKSSASSQKKYSWGLEDFAHIFCCWLPPTWCLNEWMQNILIGAHVFRWQKFIKQLGFARFCKMYWVEILGWPLNIKNPYPGWDNIGGTAWNWKKSKSFFIILDIENSLWKSEFLRTHH